MTNKEIYKKTLVFSIRKILFDLISLLVVLGLCTLGFVIAGKVLEGTANAGLIGLAIGLVLGLVLVAIVSHFFGYVFKAGQIAMMTRAVTEGSLPDNVYAEGKRVVKERFATVALYYAATNAIKGVFQQLGRAITKIGDSIGGDAGGAVGSAISSAINTLVSYLCDCCLGWVFYRSDKNAAAATLEGAALFFKHGKTLAKNMGRIFGMGLLSLLVIGGAFAGVAYIVLASLGSAIDPIVNIVSQAMAESTSTSYLVTVLKNPAFVPIAIAVVIGIVIWSMVHSAFIRPFILTGVLRNYIESGIKDAPSKESYAKLESLSPKFKKLRAEAE